ncbi:MAG: hypothetical protein PVS3B1_33530 [Ktedonobacteraceae bacterium]
MYSLNFAEHLPHSLTAEAAISRFHTPHHEDTKQDASNKPFDH